MPHERYDGGGLSSCYWDFSVVCDGEKPGSAREILGGTSEAWNPRKVLREAFGRHADVALDACRQWAQNEAGLRDAVSAACEWANAQDDLGRKPGNYVRKSLSRALPEAARKEGPDRWYFAKAGSKCPECDGKGSIGDVPCDCCDGEGKFAKRTWARRYRVKAEPYNVADIRALADIDEDGEMENLALAGKSRFNQDDRAWYAEGSPDQVTEKGPPRDQLWKLQYLVGHLLRLYLKYVVKDPVTSLAVWYTLADRMSLREAAGRVKADGFDVSYRTIKNRIDAVLAEFGAMWDEAQKASDLGFHKGN